MNGKIILNLAISLDGYIADSDGGYDWIGGDGNTALNTENKQDFTAFTNSIDVVVMGRACYEQGMADSYGEKTVLVATSQQKESSGNVRFINGNITDIVKAERDSGKNVYLFGGGVTIDPFIKEDIIDEYIVGVLPIILGKGRKLFLENNPKLPLKLDSYSIEEGVVVLGYSRRV